MLLKSINNCVQWNMYKFRNTEVLIVSNKERYAFSYYTNSFNNNIEKKINISNYEKFNLKDFLQDNSQNNVINKKDCKCAITTSLGVINLMPIKKCDKSHQIYNCVNVIGVSNLVNLNNYKFNSKSDLLNYIKQSKNRKCKTICNINTPPQPIDKTRIGKVKKIPKLDKNYNYEKCLKISALNNTKITTQNKTQKPDFIKMLLLIICVVLAGLLVIVSTMQIAKNCCTTQQNNLNNTNTYEIEPSAPLYNVYYSNNEETNIIEAELNEYTQTNTSELYSNLQTTQL